MSMNVLVACEYSGRVRDAFIARGHDAISCDLLPTDQPGPHIQGDVREVDFSKFDLVIAHPPCTYLTNAGVRWLHTQPLRWGQMREAAELFRWILEQDVERIAVENPIMHRYAVEIIGRRQDQVVQPWMFGHKESKGTGLWLKGLEPLTPTNDVKAEMMKLPVKERNRIHHLPPSADRWKLRSTTFAGIAEAMAEQWGGRVQESAEVLTHHPTCDHPKGDLAECPFNKEMNGISKICSCCDKCRGECFDAV